MYQYSDSILFIDWYMVMSNANHVVVTLLHTRLTPLQKRLQLGIVSKITRQGGMQSIRSCEIPPADIVLANSHFAEGGFGTVYDCTLQGGSVGLVKDVSGPLACKCVPVDLQDHDALQMTCR
jgi:hypothetical protein